MYKMVVIDLDGTLLNDKKQVSRKNAETINKVHKEKGVYFVIATGNNLKYTTKITEAIGENTTNQYIIASNGAVIKDNVKGKYLLEKYLNKEEVIKFIGVYREHNLSGLVQTCDAHVTDDENEAHSNQNLILVKDLKQYYIENEISTTSLITIAGKEKDLKEVENKIANEFTELDSDGISDFTIDNGKEIRKIKYMDIMKKGSNKASAVKILAKHLNIDKEEIIVMGDGPNDAPMFEVAGYRVAMENGHEDLKKQADYITCNNNQDGVAKALEEIFYKGENKI